MLGREGCCAGLMKGAVAKAGNRFDVREKEKRGDLIILKFSYSGTSLPLALLLMTAGKGSLTKTCNLLNDSSV